MTTKFFSFFFVALTVVFSFPVVAGAHGVPEIFPRTIFPGDAVVVSVSSGVTHGSPVVSSTLGSYVGLVMPYQSSTRIIFGLPPTAKPGQYWLKVRTANDHVMELPVTVTKRVFARVDLGIPKEVDLTPQTLTQGLQATKQSLTPLFQTQSADITLTKPFGLPLYDNRQISSPFGEVRVTGGTEIRHLGVDLKAKAGVAVAAMNDGVVRKAYVDPVYGNSVIVDHGHGIYTMYLHLEKIKTTEGAPVKRGAVIGTVGSTGLSTASHLHLTVKIGEVSVDPIRFVSSFR